MPDFKVTKTDKSRINDVDWNNLGFGVNFSDHMYLAEYKDGKWQEGEIMPYGPMQIEPGNMTLHYGQSIFEGMKAFRDVNGKEVNLFRPEQNAKRMARSAERVCIPPYNEKIFVEAIKELVKVDQNWIPKKHGQALYIRPLAFGDSNFLGVHASETYKFIIMTSPVASYYKEGLNPVKILVQDKYVRAVKGGLGQAKTAANYAASLLAGKEAKEQGFAQVLWLDGLEHKFVDEVGAMNIMFVIDGTIITPPLEQGSILEGVIRKSVLKLAHEKGINVEERMITIDEIVDAYKDGKLQEVFGTGTAAVISPVGELNYKGNSMVINNMKIGKMAQMFYDEITGIQYGEREDKYNWLEKIKID